MTTNQLEKFDSMTPQQAFNSTKVLEKFRSVLNGRETQFVTSLLSIINSNSYLAKATNTSIMNAAMKAATLNLPIEPSLGMAYVVPYNRSEKQGNTWVKINEAQFQMGYRGFIQLAQRSGQIRNINCDVIYKEEFLRYDKVYGTLHLTDEQVDSGEVIGYFASLELINGFRKMIFWKKEKVIEHARKYSKTYDKQAGDFKPGTPWSTEFDAMAQKTLIKTLLRNYAPLSIEIQEAIKLDDTDSNVNEVKKAKDVTPYNETSGQDILDKMTSKAIVEDTTEDTAISETEAPNVTVDAETGEILDEEEPF